MKRPAHSSRFSAKAGFTLLELTIVLAVLALLTVMASREIAKQQHRLRMDQSNRLLEQIELAVVGDRFAAGQALLDAPPDFLSDMGRLPVAQTNIWWSDKANTNEWLALSELFIIPTNVPPHGLYAATNRADGAAAAHDMDERVKVPAGWRGPYMRVPPGAEWPFLWDGWGNPMVTYLFANPWDSPPRLQGDGVLSNDMPVTSIHHFGADGVEDGEGDNRDASITFTPNAVITSGELINWPSTCQQATIRLYALQPGTGSSNEAPDIMIWEAKDIILAEGGGSFTFTDSGIPAGWRILCASGIDESAQAVECAPYTVYLRPGNNHIVYPYRPAL